jgi:mono/diheme cytochrome c family protein
VRTNLKVAVPAVTAVVLVAVASGLGAARDTSPSTSRRPQVAPGTYKLKAPLTSRQEVPRPKGAAAGSGQLTGALTVASATKTTLVWRLTFSRLTGPALAAHIHLGAGGKAGPIVVPLCGPCASGAHGTYIKRLPAAVLSAIVSGKTYVNVHTKLNPGGEIRGQVAATGTSGGGGGADPYAKIVVPETPALIAQGKALSDKYSCQACHTIDGTPLTGPTWKGLAGSKVKLTTGQTVDATDGYLIWSILQPDAQIVDGYSSGVMSTAIGNLPLSQAEAMVAYIKTLK